VIPIGPLTRNRRGEGGWVAPPPSLAEELHENVKSSSRRAFHPISGVQPFCAFDSGAALVEGAVDPGAVGLLSEDRG
jgi:hypothetical protein